MSQPAIPGFQAPPSFRLESCVPRLSGDGTGRIPLVSLQSSRLAVPACKLIHNTTTVIDDPTGLNVFWSRNGSGWDLVYVIEEALFPGIYRLFWSLGTLSGFQPLVVEDTPFNPLSSSYFPDASSSPYEWDIIARGKTEIPAGDGTVVIDLPFVVDTIHKVPAWSLLEDNLPVIGSSVRVVATHERGWTLNCGTSSTVRVLSWVVY